MVSDTTLVAPRYSFVFLDERSTLQPFGMLKPLQILEESAERTRKRTGT